MPLRPLLGLTLSLTFLAPACADDEPIEPVVVTEDEIPCSGVNEAGIWQSVPPLPDKTCEWFEYRARTTYQFPHSLGRVPAEFFAYMSFSSDGSSAGQPGGDTFLIDEATEDYVIVRNSTNQAFYLRLVLE